MRINSDIYNRKISLSSLISILLLILLSSLVFAIPDSLTLQGKLTDLSGSSQQGTFNFTFKVYDSFTDGNTLYQVINRSVTTDVNGIYDIILYNLSSLNFSDQYYLGITVQGDNESRPRINLTSSPYSFRANISDDLNKENKYIISGLNITGNLTVEDKITFRFGQIIDNLVNGFLRITGKLNVTGNVSIAQDTLFVDGTSGKVGIGTTDPTGTLSVIGNFSVEGDANITGSLTVNGTDIKAETNISILYGNDGTSNIPLLVTSTGALVMSVVEAGVTTTLDVGSTGVDLTLTGDFTVDSPTFFC